MLNMKRCLSIFGDGIKSVVISHIVSKYITPYKKIQQGSKCCLQFSKWDYSSSFWEHIDDKIIYSVWIINVLFFFTGQ